MSQPYFLHARDKSCAWRKFVLPKSVLCPSVCFQPLCKKSYFAIRKFSDTLTQGYCDNLWKCLLFERKGIGILMILQWNSISGPFIFSILPITQAKIRRTLQFYHRLLELSDYIFNPIFGSVGGSKYWFSALKQGAGGCCLSTLVYQEHQGLRSCSDNKPDSLI